MELPCAETSETMAEGSLVIAQCWSATPLGQGDSLMLLCSTSLLNPSQIYPARLEYHVQQPITFTITIAFCVIGPQYKVLRSVKLSLYLVHVNLQYSTCTCI